MNNRIESTNNISFNARHLNFINKRQIPKKITEAITKNSAINEFIQEGNPKTFLGKIIDFFRKNETLNVIYKRQKNTKFDPYHQQESITFLFSKGSARSIAKIEAFQGGTLRKIGTIPKIGEHPIYKAPMETSTDKLVKQIENIKDMNSLLK